MFIGLVAHRYFHTLPLLFAPFSDPTGLILCRFAFILGALTALLAFLLVGVGAAIYTAIIYRARRSINGATVANGTPLGIHVAYGNALWMIWGAVGALLLAIVPFLLVRRPFLAAGRIAEC